MIDLNENVVNQTEELVNEINASVNAEELDELENLDLDSLFDVSDEEINSSLNALEATHDSSAAMAQKLVKKTKKSTSQLADEVVKEFLETRSDASWKKLQEFFWWGLKQFAFKYMNNLDDAEDMTIETFLRVLENINNYDPARAKFSTWLWTICRNNCFYLINQRKKLPTLNIDISDIYDSTLLSNSISEETQEYKIVKGAVTDISKDEICDELYNVSINEMKNIGGMPGQILKMKLVDDMKIREIADKLNMNESTVKNHLYRGKENLSRILRINHKNLYDMYIDSMNGKNSLYL